MVFILKSDTRYYVVQRVKRNGNWTVKYLRKATDEEVALYCHQREHLKQKIKVSCDNPHCDKLFDVTRKEKLRVKLVLPRKKLLFEFMHCCQECRNEHYKLLTMK